MAMEITHLLLAYPPMLHLDEDSEEEVDSTIGLVDTWLTPPTMLPTGDDMHPPTECFSGAYLGDEWMYNKIDNPKYFRFLILDLSIPCHQIVTP
jgi:hypothetical protein